MRLFVDESGSYVGLYEPHGVVSYQVYVTSSGDFPVGELKEVTDLTVEQYEALGTRVALAIEAACEGSRYLREERLAILARSK